MSFSATAILFAWVALALLALALSGIVRQLHSLIKAQPQSLPFPGPGLRTAAPILDDEAHRAEWARPTLVLFVDADCTACDRVLPRLERMSLAFMDILDFVAVFADDPRSLHHAAIRAVAHGRGAFSRFRVAVTPYAVFVNESGYVERAQPVGSPEILQTFVERARDSVLERVGAS